MHRHRPLKRRKPIRRVSNRKRDAQPEWEEVRHAVWLRSEGICDLCGRAVGSWFDVHHRRARSRGGTDALTNLVTLHRPCHAWVHSEPVRATRLGFIVPTWAQPEGWPLRLRGGDYVQFWGTGWYPSAPLFEQTIGRTHHASRPRHYRPRTSSGEGEDYGPDDES